MAYQASLLELHAVRPCDHCRQPKLSDVECPLTISTFSWWIHGEVRFEFSAFLCTVHP